MIEFKRKLGKYIRDNFGGLNLLKRKEENLLEKSDKLEIPPLFIIGAPRTGSTFFYELLVKKYKFAYISNISSVFYKSPFYVTSLFFRFYKKYFNLNKTKNEYGMINNIWAPSEAAEVFRYWFDNYLNNNFIKKVRNSVYSFSFLFNGPFIAKNMNNSMRIYNIHKIFPNSLFVFLKRNPLFTAQSLLIARMRFYNTYDKWWSTKPLNYFELTKLSPYSQVLLQIKEIENYIYKFFSEKKCSYIEIKYEDICQDPKKELEKIQLWYKIKGYNLKSTFSEKNSNIQLKSNNTKKLPDRVWNDLFNKYKKFYNSLN